MKAYGLPRICDVGSPDITDCLNFGLKTAAMGTGHTANRGSAKQKAHRRVWKKAARREAKNEIKGGIDG